MGKLHQIFDTSSNRIAPSQCAYDEGIRLIIEFQGTEPLGFGATLPLTRWGNCGRYALEEDNFNVTPKHQSEDASFVVFYKRLKMNELLFRRTTAKRG